MTKFFHDAQDNYTKEDFLIICGDVGVCGVSGKVHQDAARDVLRKLPVTVLFVDGNHENFDDLYSYPEEYWHGGKVHIIEDDIIHLMRGQVFDIEGKSFFTFGGGYSVDKIIRTEGIDWFPQEMPSREEYQEGMNHLQEVDFMVDYIITHTAPTEIVSELGLELIEEEIELGQYLQKISEGTDFYAWYFGHFHVDESIDDTYFCVYDEVVKLE